MSTQRATRDSWKIQPMPEAKTSLQLYLSFSMQDHARLELGLIPQQMEDKWFIYLQDDWLYFHRSWTGVCIYQVRLGAADEGYIVVETWVNRDPEQYKNTDDGYDVRLLSYLIDRLLLGEDAPFPTSDQFPQGLEAVYRHHIVGYSRANDEDR